MEYDEDKVDEMALALMYLGTHDVTEYEDGKKSARTWKGFAWSITDRLHEKGLISDPKSKAKSVVLTLDGFERSKELFEKHFVDTEDPESSE